MKAVILAAGKGTRMGALTDDVPKPMLRVRDKPILEHIVEGMRDAASVREFCIITGWRAEVIESYFGDGSRWGTAIRYARQVVQDGTGKAPELAKEFVGNDEFVLTYGDILVEPETYGRMLERFRKTSCSALLVVTVGEDATKGGLSLFDEQFNLRRLIEKPNAEQLVQLRAEGWLKPGQPVYYNAGIYIFRPVVFEFTARLQKSPRGEYELTDALTAMMAAGHRIAGQEIRGKWADVRDPTVLAAVEGKP